MTDEERDPRSRTSGTREIFEELRDWSGKVFQKVKEEADILSTKGKLKLDITTLKSKRGSEFRKLGMKVHHLLEQGKLEFPEASENLTRIEELTKKIEERENTLKGLAQKAGEDLETGEAAEETKSEE